MAKIDAAKAEIKIPWMDLGGKALGVHDQMIGNIILQATTFKFCV